MCWPIHQLICGTGSSNRHKKTTTTMHLIIRQNRPTTDKSRHRRVKKKISILLSNYIYSGRLKSWSFNGSYKIFLNKKIKKFYKHLRRALRFSTAEKMICTPWLQRLCHSGVSRKANETVAWFRFPMRQKKVIWLF